MEDAKNIVLSADQFEALLGKVGQPTQPAPRQQFDGMMASNVDQKRLMRSNEFNRKLVNSKDMVTISIPAVYSEYIGDSVTVSVNGNTVKCPVNDSVFSISKAHNHQLQKKLRHINVVSLRNKQQAPLSLGNSNGDWGLVTGI